MNHNERDIRVIRQVLRGNRDAYADIVERYKSPIYNLAVRLTGSLSEAEDLAQDVFIRVYEILDRFDDSKRFFPWMYTVALNVIRNHIKKKRSIFLRFQTNTVADKWHKDTNTPEKSVSDSQQHERLARYILKLPILQKEAIVLRYYQSLAFEEIAEIQACSVSAAKMRVYRGLEQLNRLLQSP
jgi:RNA polymerase sigma-70 factor (ECF subfamily)